MSPHLSLSEIQSRFKQILKTETLPHDATSVGESLGIRETADFSAEMRMGVYHYAYFARIKDALAQDFPRLCQEIGDENFSNLIRRYLERYPSRYASLTQVGQYLPQFLSESPLFRDQPQLSQLAALEWQRFLCSWSGESEVSNFSALMALSDDARMKQVLLLAPSTRFSKSPTETQNFTEGSSAVVFFRVDGEIQELHLNSDMESLLLAIRNGQTIGELVTWMETSETLAAQAMDWILDWVSQGLIVGFRGFRGVRKD